MSNTSKSVPLISICCVTYNHKDYIAIAIEGFLMQKTEFEVEIIIYDDASTDETTKIIKKYEQKYPNLIRGIYSTVNQYSKGKLPYASFVWPVAKGKYLALCEGDDYWTDPCKLQKQVNFLESNPTYIGCSHESLIRYEGSLEKDVLCSTAKLEYSRNKQLIKDYTIKEVLKTVLFQSSTLVFKNIASSLPDCIRTNQLWDVALFLSLGCNGKIHFFNETMSIYLKHPKALTTYGDTWRSQRVFSLNMIAILTEINSHYHDCFSKLFRHEIINYKLDLFFSLSKDGKSSSKISVFQFQLFDLPFFLMAFCRRLSGYIFSNFQRLFVKSKQIVKKWLKNIIIRKKQDA